MLALLCPLPSSKGLCSEEMVKEFRGFWLVLSIFSSSDLPGFNIR